MLTGVTSNKAFARRRLFQRRFPFRLKIILPYFFLGLGLLLGGVLVVTQIVFESVSERFTNQLIESGKMAAEWMVKEENGLLESLRFLTYTSGVAEATAARDADALRALTYPIALNGGLESAAFLDAQGKMVFSMRHREGGNLEEYLFSKDGADYSGLTFVRNALEAQTDVLGDKYSGVIEQEDPASFYVAGPLFDAQGQRVGVALVGVSLKTLVKHLREQTLAQITLYDPQGRVLASSFPEPKALIPQQAEQILDLQNTSSYRRSQDEGRRQVEVLNTGYDELLGPWKARGADLGLTGVALFKNVLVNPSMPTRVYLIALVTVAFAVIIVLGLFIANLVTNPLEQLTRASDEMSKGNLRVQLPAPVANDELADLTNTFNAMVSSVNQAQEELLDAYDNTLMGWSLALEMREKETAEHGRRVTNWTVALACAMGLRGAELVNIRRGAMLHDIGKMGVPDSVLLKPGKLTAEEFKLMQNHTEYAWNFLSTIEYLRPVLDVPYCHHEKWDGSGYPRGLKGEEIPLAARIFAIIDVWDAITNDRVYRKAMTRDEALHVIQSGRGSHFDPQVVDVFLAMLPGLEADSFRAAPAMNFESANIDRAE